MKKNHRFSEINGYDLSHLSEDKFLKLLAKDKLYDKDLNHLPMAKLIKQDHKRRITEVAVEFLKDSERLIKAMEEERNLYIAKKIKEPFFKKIFNEMAVIEPIIHTIDFSIPHNYDLIMEMWVNKVYEQRQKQLRSPMKTTQDYINEVKANLDLLNDSEYVLKFFNQAEQEQKLVLTKEQKRIIFIICLDACNNDKEEARKLARYRSVIRLIE